jgi:PAS domain S-box-containing protein
MNKKKTSIRAGNVKEQSAPIGERGQKKHSKQSYLTPLRLRAPSLQARVRRNEVAGSKSNRATQTGSRRSKAPETDKGDSRMGHSKRDVHRKKPPVLPHGSNGEENADISGQVSRKETRDLKSLRKALAGTGRELRKTAGNLAKLSEFLHTLLNNIPIPLLIVGRDYRLRHASRGAQRMFNLKSSDPAIRVTDTMLAPQVPGLRKLLADILAGGSAVQREMQDDDGHWYRVVFQPYEVPRVGIDGTVISFSDIDAEKRMVALHSTDQRRAGQMLDAIGGVFVELDPEGVIVHMNRRGCDLLGYREQEVVGTNWFDGYVAEASRGALKTATQQLTSRGSSQPLSTEIVVVMKNGDQRLLRWQTVVSTDGAGLPRGVFGMGEDITLWRAAQTSTRESEERFRLLLGMEPDSNFLTTDASGNVTSWFGGAGPANKYLAQEVIGKHMSLFFTPEDFLGGRPMRLLRVAETRGRYEEVGWCVGSDGSRRRAKFVVSPVRDHAGKVTGFACVIRFMREESLFDRS